MRLLLFNGYIVVATILAWTSLILTQRLFNMMGMKFFYETNVPFDAVLDQ
jgi:hypothetical protein